MFDIKVTRRTNECFFFYNCLQRPTFDIYPLVPAYKASQQFSNHTHISFTLHLSEDFRSFIFFSAFFFIMERRLSALISELCDMRPVDEDDTLELFATFDPSADRTFATSGFRTLNVLGIFGASRRENALVLNLLTSDFMRRLVLGVSAFAVETRNLLSVFGCFVESPLCFPLRLAARLAMPCRPLGRAAMPDSFNRDDCNKGCNRGDLKDSRNICVTETCNQGLENCQSIYTAPAGSAKLTLKQLNCLPIECHVSR